MTTPSEQQALHEEISALEEKLHNAQSRLDSASSLPNSSIPSPISSTRDSSLHTLLLLADSALPLGSFAFSSGLESYLAHHPRSSSEKSPQSLFHTFLELSLQSLASTALPYVLAAYRDPSRLEELDNDFDASTPCTVARRASVAQGKALLGVWERSFRPHFRNEHAAAIKALESFTTSLRSSNAGNAYPINGHLAPLWGVITLILELPRNDAAYLFLFSHARTVISAAVRASVLGPYQAQSVLASQDLRTKIEEHIDRYGEMRPEDAGQSVPVVDLWVGRHELLYSRIFNS